MHLIVIVTEHVSPASAALIGGSIGGILILTLIIAIVIFFAVRACYTRRSQASATCASTQPGTAPTNSSSIPLSTQPYPRAHQPPPTTAFNLPQPQPQSAPKLTFTQPSNPSITDAPPPAYHLHKTFANYSENKKPSDDPPPYRHPSYDAAMEETKS